VKRLVLCAATAVVSCSAFVMTAGGTSSAASPPGLTVVNGTFLPAPGRAHSHAARGVINTGSTNWSGYVQSAFSRHTFTAVTDTFVVPTVTSSVAGSQYAADWVGIGGYNDRTLVQDGIQTDVTTTADDATTISYDAWTETLPRAERRLKLAVHAGDTVTATVQETATNKWLMTVTDVTTAQSAGRSVRYRSSGLSAEAIHERPCIGEPCSNFNNLAALAQTTDVTFEPGSLSESAPGPTPTYEPLLCSAAAPLCPADNATLYSVAMDADDGTTVIAIPSIPNTTDTGFTLADGDVPPSPPT
jgi:hypothetical protein